MIKIAICDDEINAIQSLNKKIDNFMDRSNIIYSVTKFTSGEIILNKIIHEQISFDVLFLDIKMDTNGIYIAKQVRKFNEKIFIVFVTAIKEYVFDAFEVSAINYLLKPIQNNKLYFTLNKIISYIYSNNYYLTIHAKDIVKKINFEDIMYCEVLNHNVFVYEFDGINKYNGSIKQLETELNEIFFRCHRSYIVNLKYVKCYLDGFAILPTEEKIPVAIRRKNDFMKALLHYHRKEVR